MSTRVRAPLAQLAGLALTLGAASVATAAEPAAPPKAPEKKAPTQDTAADAAADADLLEFLGGIDAEPDKEDGWLDFLSRADLRRLAGAKQ
ncbi:MAG: hypothetical protein MUC68_11775 [Burkholderiaceae bacterium]|jgi:hypothetical protein|nr:hypothetical protein [Burkholderiaceae bacterium]